MELLAQYRGTIIGSHSIELIDLIKLNDNLLAVFRKSSNNDFKLEMIQKNEFNEIDFNNVLTDLTNYYRVGLFLHINNCSYVLNPEFMPGRYYSDLIHLNNKYLDLNDIHLKEINNLLKDLREEINKESFGLKISKVRNH